MARGLILWTQTQISGRSFFSTSISEKFRRISCISTHSRLLPLRPLLCKCSSPAQEPIIDISKYAEAFSRRMAMAGLKPHHRIAMGVSGGPDSMALCVLTANWKTNSLSAVDNGCFIGGLLAIVVDHGLRSESREEAEVVSHRVAQMGIRCEISCCDWLEGRPKQGHLQEAARDMRYQIFQKVCVQHQIDVLLIAHHADDQTELFILRLSRSSGVLGLAGMPFTSQIFSVHTHFYDEASKNYGILLVRPLLDFSKDDMYEICRGGNQVWVEDPTNQNQLYARNRIRMSLGDLSSCILKSELHAIISACRKTRLYVDRICSTLLYQAVTIMDLGYAVIDLEILNHSEINGICLSKFVALVLQFISQRHRPIRGGALKLVSDYLQTFPCKTSLTAAGCYLCPAPGAHGTKALVCCSVNCPLPSTTESFHNFGKPKPSIHYELDKIINDGKSYSDNFLPDESDVHFLDIKPESILSEAKRLNVISESIHRSILSLQREEIRRFRVKTRVKSDCESEQETDNFRVIRSRLLKQGQVSNFMNRFFVTWNMREKNGEKNANLEEWDLLCPCESCVIGDDREVKVRPMVESDWLYLAKLSKCQRQHSNLHLEYARLSAQRALCTLRSIPVAARRGLAVLVNHKGLLLSIPSINFNHCPCLITSAIFRPRIPLGGGHTSFL